MNALQTLSSLHCELKIMDAKNIQVNRSNGYLFVRSYLSAGNNKRVRLDSRQVSSNRDLESFSLDCIGTKQSMDMIIHGKIILELRWRSNTSWLGGSQLLGRSKVSWRSVFESPSMELETWVMMKSKQNVVIAPSFHISMKIEVPSGVVGLVEKNRKNKWDESCGCCHGDFCNSTGLDSEFFLLGVALDAF